MREMTTKEVQRMSLDILQDFHNFCVKNGLHYSLSGGTLLGAIRHNGFIPWDDDIDVQMPRPDYDKFIHTYQSDKGYAVYCRELPGFDKKKMTYAYARVVDVQSTYVDTGIVPWIATKIGVWIDVLPCDGISSDYNEAERHLNKVRKLVRNAYWLGAKNSPWTNILKGKNLIKTFRFGIKKALSIFVTEDTFNHLFRIRKEYDYISSQYFFVTPHYGMGEWQPKKYMENFELHMFENAEFYIMSGWDANLKSLYGNYMQLPPEDKRVSHDYNRYYWKD